MNLFQLLNNMESGLKDILQTKNYIISILTLGVLFLIYKFSTREMKNYLLKKTDRWEDVRSFLFLWRYVWWGLIVVFFLISFSGSISSLGISAAFLGMLLGWSLQAPVTGIVAWLMIILKRPFKIGDRVIISGITGDVMDITLTHILLNQVGGTIGGEERSGRGVLIPNAILFQQVIHNYTYESEYILDEVSVLITHESNLEEAERILLKAARDATAKIISETGKEPFTRIEFTDHGIKVILRYYTLAKERQKISTEITKIIFYEFKNSKNIEFCYPHTEILYMPKSLKKNEEYFFKIKDKNSFQEERPWG